MIQPIEERIRLTTDVDYIVIIDMNRIRYSHPSESKLGTVFEGGDVIKAFSQHEYISKAHGFSAIPYEYYHLLMSFSQYQDLSIITVFLPIIYTF
ncbi:hypothetical protein [Lysinibacillus xylanilyticus]|uniref:hypothetical protein n=1 Tax=Lysinibacillus xylanilyticus TaxID=582475 RepID=UPI003D06A51E